MPSDPGRRVPGIGDRWLAGERLPGVQFALHDAVEIVAGERAGETARVMLLARVGGRVEYVVSVAGSGEIRVAQDALRQG